MGSNRCSACLILSLGVRFNDRVTGNRAQFATEAKSVHIDVDGEAVVTVDELDAALTRAFKQDGPYIIDCKIDKDEFVLPVFPPGGSMDDIIVRLEAERELGVNNRQKP